MSDIINEIDNDQNLPEEEDESVVVDDGQTYATGESAAIAEAAAAEAKLWAQESERQAGYASSSAIDAVEAKEYAEAAITDPNFVAVATDLASTPSNIKTVATNISNVNNVASNISNVNAVASNATNINAVNANKTNIDTVAGDKTNIDKVANKISNVNTVGSNINNVNTVASNISDVGTVAGIASDVSAVSTNNANITAVANNSSNINAVASNSSNINAVAGNATNINAVNSNKININAVASNTTNINAVAENATNINNVAGDLANINAVAADLTNINNASTYADNAEKWAEGTDGEVTPLGGTHSAKGWAEIAEQAASGVQNPANRDLSNLTNAGEYRFNTQNETISNCVLEIPQDIKLELNNGTLTLKAGSKVYFPNGVGVFGSKEIVQDRTISISYNGIYIICSTLSGDNITARYLKNSVSGAGATTRNGLAYDTTTNKINYYTSTGEIGTQYSFPVAIVTVSNGAISSIDKVFNGAGYIGHHAFVLPGVKGLRPDGKQNGNLVSVNYLQNQVTIIEITNRIKVIGTHNSGNRAEGWYGYVEVNDISEYAIASGYRVYDKTNNITYMNNYQTIRQQTPIVFCDGDGTNITKFDIRQPYEGARDLLGDNTVSRALSVKGNKFKIYQPTLSHSILGMFFLFVFPDGHNILYDTGYINEENDIDTFLSSLGIKHLDVVIVSHFHGDHAGCAPHIINNYCDINTKFYKCMDCDPSQFTSDQSDVTTYENAYKTALTNKGFTYTIPTNKSSVELFNGTVELTFYNTDTTNLQYYYGAAEMIEDLSLGSTANNTSMCCLVRAYGTSVFMTGDIEYAGEKAIADYVPQNVDLLQLPHHGVSKNGYAPFFARLNPKVTMFQRNQSTTGQETKYWWRYMKYNNDIPVINNATTTGIELECYNGNVKLLNGRIISMLGDLNDYNITCVLPTPYDNVHNADEVATWTIADVVNMCQYGVKWDFRLGYTYDTTQFITEVNTLVPSTSWVIIPHIEYITIQDRTDITKAEVKAKSVSDHS